jgi:hypothetical protein
MASPVTEDAPVVLPSEDAVREHAYLVARGVRPMALIQTFAADPMVCLRVATRLEAIGVETGLPIVPFVVENGDGTADCGYAAAGWVVDLLRWASSNDVPKVQRMRVVGLLLGYSAEAIAIFEERAPRRIFTSPGPSP